MILITGSRGLLGSELIGRLVQRNWMLRGTDLLNHGPEDTREYVQADLRDPSACRRLCKGVDTVVHTAALQHHSRPPKIGKETFFWQNVEMSRNIADAAEAAGVQQIIFVSSDMVYGIPRHGPFRESDTPNPIGPYGRSKLASEQACLAKRCAGIKVTVFRPRLIVGPGRLGVLTKLFDRIRAGKSVPLIGDGRNRYQMVSVWDVANAILLAVQKKSDGVFNLGSSPVPTVAALINHVARRAGSPSRVIRTPRLITEAVLWMLYFLRVGPLVPEQFRIAAVDYVLDTSAAQTQLGWSPRFDDVEMLWQAYERYVNGPTDNG
jgi:nucleoside-diphosphate-sugar epimerase